jgi:riboflavin-specific deaminase-like protein
MSSPANPPDPIALNRLLPGEPASLTAGEVVEGLRLWEPTSAYGPGGRVRVFLNMASTADGRATVGGRSGPIGNRADRELFRALRTTVDAVLVGAGTVRAERYQRLVRDGSRRRLRCARGLAEEPLACIVSASLDLPADIPLLADPAARVVILTPSPDRTLPGAAAPVEYVRSARAGQLDLSAALGELHTRLGVRTLLCEGGPHLNGQLLTAGLVDELFLSLAPKLAGGGLPAHLPAGDSHPGAPPAEPLRIVRGPEFDPPVQMRLLGALESEGQLLLRYGIGGAGGPG